MIFGLRLEPSITEFRVRMTDLLHMGSFLVQKRFFQIFFICPDDLGHDHALPK